MPKGPSLDPAERRLAVEVEDHPLEYGGFEGVIPEGEYGGGPTLIWDRGAWAPMGDVDESLKSGTLKFRLAGEKLKGGWTLARLKRRPGDTRTTGCSSRSATTRRRRISIFWRGGRRALSRASGSRSCARPGTKVWHSNRPAARQTRPKEPIETRQVSQKLGEAGRSQARRPEGR